MPSMERVLELRADAFADDVDVSDAMLSWSEERLTHFFESGGEDAGGGEATEPPAPSQPLPPPDRPLRILSLHGGGGNKSINQMQMARLKSTLGATNCTFDYLEGTRVWKDEEVDPNLKRMFGDGPYYGWYGVTNSKVPNGGQVNQINDPNYGQTLMDPSITFTYFEYEEALNRLEAHIESNGPYDLLSGFSQGAIMVTMLTARRLQRAAKGEGPPPSWKANLLLSALPPRASPYAPIFPPDGTPMHRTPPIASFPAIACMGRKDGFFSYGEDGLRSIYGKLQWFEHEGGHATAREAEVNDALAKAVWQAAGFSPP